MACVQGFSIPEYPGKTPPNAKSRVLQPKTKQPQRISQAPQALWGRYSLYHSEWSSTNHRPRNICLSTLAHYPWVRLLWSRLFKEQRTQSMRYVIYLTVIIVLPFLLYGTCYQNIQFMPYTHYI